MPARRHVARLLPLGAAALLGCDAAPTAVRLHVQTAPALVVDGLEVEMRDLRHETPMTETLELRIPEAWAGQPERISVDGLEGDLAVAVGAVLVVPVAGATVDATVTLVDADCPRPCDVGEVGCAGDAVRTCGLDVSGCPAWTEAEACPDDAPFCSAGACDDTCGDECDAGDTRCAGDGAEQACGQADSDECRDWTAAVACGEGQACGEADACDVIEEPCDDTCEIERFAVAGGQPAVLAIHDGALYWTAFPSSGGFVEYAPLDGGELGGFSFQNGPLALGFDDDRVYWTDARESEFETSIGSVNYWSWTAEEVYAAAPDQDGARGLAIDATTIYWTNQYGGQIRRRAKPGGSTIETIATGEESPWAIAVDATHAYWTSLAADRVRRWPKAGGAVETFAADQVGAQELVLDDAHAYWGAVGRVARRAKAGGDVEVLATGLGTVDALALDDAHVYWLAPEAGQLARRAKAGGDVEILATGLQDASGLAIAGDHAYVGIAHDREILRVPLPEACTCD
jgi:hypothetical protein